MTAERVNPPRWRRKRAEETELELVPSRAEEIESVPQPRPPLTSRNPTQGGSWAGRASSHRREQVKARGPEAAPVGPTGPVDAQPGRRRTTQEEPAVASPVLQELWAPVVDRLRRELDGLISVVLCSTDGVPLAAHGLAQADTTMVAQLTSSVFAAGRSLMAAREETNGVETIKLASGQTRTIITTVVEEGGGVGLLSVTARDASVGVMLVQTREASDMLHDILARARD